MSQLADDPSLAAPQEPTAALPRPPATHTLAIAGALAFMTVVAYWGVWDNRFVNFDDQNYVYSNPNVLAGLSAAGVRWAFTTNAAQNWHPLTWLSLQSDATLFGENPGGYHLTNLLLHVLNVLMLFLALRRLTGAEGKSAVVAAFFAVHPLHVESVAWIAERKDVLSAFFWLLTLYAYADYAERPGWRRMAGVVAAFVLGLLTKPMLVTLPCVLLLLDYWPLRRPVRPWRLVLEKLPLFLLSAISCGVTVWAQGHAVMPLSRIPIPWRIMNAFVAYVSYLEKMSWPSDLAVYYPHLYDAKPAWAVGGAAAAAGFLLAVTVLVVWGARRWPYALVGWLWYLGTLVPVIGIVHVGSQAMADRYMYLPSIGALVVVVWGLGAVVSRVRVPAAAVGVVVAAAVAALALRTHDQIRYWKDSVAMYERSLASSSYNPEMEKNLGVTYMRLNRTTEARHYLDLAIRLDPVFADAYYNRALLRDHLGDAAGAEADYRSALRLKPDHVDAHELYGVMLFNHGRVADAAEQLAETVRLKPGSAQVRDNYGAALALLGRRPEAVEQFRKAIELDPGYAPARDHLQRAEAELRGAK